MSVELLMLRSLLSDRSSDRPLPPEPWPSAERKEKEPRS